jgi:hypothetical protein
LFAFFLRSTSTATSGNFLQAASEDILPRVDRNLAKENPSQHNVTSYRIAGLAGKCYLKSATATIAVNVFQETRLFPYNRHIFDENNFLEESQPNLTSCLLESSLPYASISEETPASSGAIPLTLTNTETASQNAMFLICSLTLVLL